MASQSNKTNKIGLIAGWGEFPFLVAQTMKAKGKTVIAVAFPGETYAELAQSVNEIHWVSIGQLGKMIKAFKTAGITQVVMAGMIRHKRLFSNLKLDLKAVTLLAKVKDKRADSLLKAVSGVLAQEGVELISPLPYLKSNLPEKGMLTRRRPTKREQEDIQFGYKIAKHLAGADVGQTVVVKEKAVIAVEAMEGTDACIVRSGEFSRGGAVVVKVLKPKQDLRFDTPVIGPNTIESLQKAKATVLAFDAGKTLFIQQEQTIALANKAKITLVGI
ncbi:UDP-2,3-diacylglucosamine diphosphatase LpxI [bacterium]|nr:UDP-2,3-diacylglucosamine diphosphatase LpxI [bacterium]